MIKLVRDNIPALYDKGELEPRGERGEFTFRKAEPKEYELLLRLKLAEEVGEVLSAPTRAQLIAELGDLKEVIYALEERLGLTPQDYLDRAEKCQRLGGFAEGRVLES